jgi:hypothetical protein
VNNALVRVRVEGVGKFKPRQIIQKIVDVHAIAPQSKIRTTHGCKLRYPNVAPCKPDL